MKLWTFSLPKPALDTDEARSYYFGAVLADTVEDASVVLYREHPGHDWSKVSWELHRGQSAVALVWSLRIP